MPDMLEDDLRPHYETWKAAPGPDTNAKMLDTLHPVMEGAIRTHVGEPNPLLMSRARRMTLDGLRGYDPAKGKLKTHLYNHLLGLKRANRQQTTILQVPERVALDRARLDQLTAELTNELGREPTDDEIANRTGFTTKRMTRIRSYAPGMAEGTAEGLLEGNLPASTMPGAAPSLWIDIVYDGLDPYHKKVMEYSLGLHGRRPLQNQEIAAKLRRSPGAISQATARIQALLDEEHDLSPFGG